MKVDAEERDLKEDIALDRFHLELEAERQSCAVLYWQSKFSEAQFAYDNAKNECDVLEARLELDIRAKAAEAGEKMTEALAKARVTSHPDLIAKLQEVAKLREQTTTLMGVVKALDHKKSQIETLRALWISGYYADPNKTPTRDLADAARTSLNKKEA